MARANGKAHSTIGAPGRVTDATATAIPFAILRAAMMKNPTILLTAVVVGALVACGGGTNEATRTFAREFSGSLRGAAQCVDTNADNINCVTMRLYGTPDVFCLGVALRDSEVWATKGPAGQQEKWESVDWKRFDDACDRWEQIGEMPVVMAGPELIKLAQEVSKSAE